MDKLVIALGLMITGTAINAMCLAFGLAYGAPWISLLAFLAMIASWSSLVNEQLEQTWWAWAWAMACVSFTILAVGCALVELVYAIVARL